RAGTGMRIDLARVHRREPGMEAFEVLTSESQERMLVVVSPEDVDEALAICRRWGLPASVIGEVTSSGRLEVLEAGEQVAVVPAASLGDGPLYERPITRPASRAREQISLVAPPDLPQAVLELVGSPNIASKRWAWEQYDHQVMLNTVVGPGHDAAVLRLPGARSRLAVTSQGNGRYCALDPYLGTQHTVAEAARNLAVVGAAPYAVTNCLNFGSPERPEVMWAFTEALRGMADACRALGTPVTGGNVSFYNETGGVAIYPTPIVGMVGVLADGVTSPPMGFRREGDLVVLIGSTHPELGGSEYARTILGLLAGELPALDLAREAAVGGVARRAIAARIVASAHDCSEGGLAVTLAEACIAGRLGAKLEPEGGLAPHLWLFSESASRMVVSIDPSHLPRLASIADEEGVPLAVLGVVGGASLRVEGAMEIPVRGMIKVYEQAFARAMGYGARAAAGFG
ncbi:MAG: AIR synthase-related protein, partial [Acidimicrobiales bacterium]